MALETDRHRLEQRQKQIDFGLATTGYANYVSWLKSNKGRVKPIPIPNIYIKCSKRSWDGQIRHWRRLLHLWDTIELPTGTSADQQFQDPCEQENVEYVDEEFPEGVLSSRNQPPRPSPQMRHPSVQGANTLNPNVNRFGPDIVTVYNPMGAYAPHYMPQMPLHIAPTPQMQYVPHFQIPPHMPHPGYTYPSGPPEWQFSMMPRGGYPLPLTGLRGEEAVAAEFLFVADQETKARLRISEAEAAILQATLFKQYCGALVAASAAQKQLVLHSTPAEPSKEWADADLGLFLNKEFGGNKQGDGPPANDELLPPSLSEPAARPSPTSPTAASDSGRSLASFVDLHLDEERYSNFRRHFGEASSSCSAASPLESPPPCWSPARLTPGMPSRRGVLSASSPGLTPSPADWFAAQRSPLPVSPRAALAFADWASPQMEQPPSETTKDAAAAGGTVAHLWPAPPS